MFDFFPSIFQTIPTITTKSNNNSSSRSSRSNISIKRKTTLNIIDRQAIESINQSNQTVVVTSFCMWNNANSFQEFFFLGKLGKKAISNCSPKKMVQKINNLTV